MDYTADALADNSAAHVIGSFSLKGVKKGDRIEWTAGNDMSRHSWWGGHWLDKIGLQNLFPNVTSGPRRTVRDNVHFTTDLNGNPVANP